MFPQNKLLYGWLSPLFPDFTIQARQSGFYPFCFRIQEPGLKQYRVIFKGKKIPLLFLPAGVNPTHMYPELSPDLCPKLVAGTYEELGMDFNRHRCTKLCPRSLI